MVYIQIFLLLQKMKRSLEAQYLSSKRHRAECSTLGKRECHRAFASQGEAKRMRSDVKVLGKHGMKLVSTPDPKRSRRDEAESYKNMLVDAHRQIHFQAQHIKALQARVRELEYANTLNNRICNPNYNYDIQCY